MEDITQSAERDRYQFSSIGRLSFEPGKISHQLPRIWDVKDSFGEAGLEAQSQISLKFTVAAGANYQISRTGSVTNETVISPYARVNFMADRRLGLSLKYQSGLKHISFSERLLENPFLIYSIPMMAEQEKHAEGKSKGIRANIPVKLPGVFQSGEGYLFPWYIGLC